MQLAFPSFMLVLFTSIGVAPVSDEAPASRTTQDAKVVAKPDAFRTLVNPQCSHCVDEAKRRAGELRDDDRVLAWIRGYSQGGGIPLRFFLVPYRVISDTYGVFVYDHEAGYMRGFEPSLDFEFYGWRNGVMVMQHKDGTLYSCLTGKAFDGPRKGHQLKPVPTIETDWGFWLEAYPGAVAYHMFEKYQPIELPKAENKESVSTRVAADKRLPAMEPVIGLTIGDQSRAYPIAALEKAGGLIQGTTVGGGKVIVLWYPPTRTAATYAPELDEEKDKPKQSVSLKVDRSVPAAPFVDTETGSRFDIVGRAVDGPLKGRTLRWLPGVQCRWFAWSAEYPDTEIVPVGAKAEATPQKPPAASDKPRAESNARPSGDEPLQAVIVDPGDITAENVSNWKRSGYHAVAAVLDEKHGRLSFQHAARAAAAGGLDLYLWIEVGRNPKLADEHPEWMASLGMHDDWHERFPNVPLPKTGEVAKAYPWVPIGYRESFDAQLARVAKLLDHASEPFAGVLLNDLQGGPASCGCGNLQCRWAIDYHVPATATRLDGNDVAGRFIAEVKKLVADKTVIPIWTTECEEIDLPKGRAPGGTTTGYCGGVPCAHGTCPKAFAEQWTALVSRHSGPVGLLATHREFQRDRKEYGDPAGWIAHTVQYLDSVPAKQNAPPFPHDRLWIVVQGYDLPAPEQQAARQVAAKTGAAAVLLALTRIDQSYTPRIVPAK